MIRSPGVSVYAFHGAMWSLSAGRHARIHVRHTWTHTYTHTAFSPWCEAVNVIRQSIEMIDQLQANRPTCFSRHSKTLVLEKKVVSEPVVHLWLFPLLTMGGKTEHCILEDTHITWSKLMLDENTENNPMHISYSVLFINKWTWCYAWLTALCAMDNHYMESSHFSC